jgi:hypothetical protein
MNLCVLSARVSGGRGRGPTRSVGEERWVVATHSVILSEAKDLIAARNWSTLRLLAMRSFASLRMTEWMTEWMPSWFYVNQSRSW